MIHCDHETRIKKIIGETTDVLVELGLISSAIEEALSKEVGVENAERLVDGAIRAGREFNHQFIFGGGTASLGSVEEDK